MMAKGDTSTTAKTGAVDVTAKIDDDIRKLEAKKHELQVEAGLVDRSQYQTWQGPFPEYTLVNSPFGEHAVPAFKILSFRIAQRINRKSLQEEEYAIPQYRDATEAELKAFNLLEAKDYLLPANNPKRPKALSDAISADDLGYSPSPAGRQFHEKSEVSR
jgi:hypothetical protein